MLYQMLRVKIHNATITETELVYNGSITLDPELIEEAGLLPNEKVQVLNVNNGARFETYIIEGERGSRVVCLNGPAARLGQVGDAVFVLAYSLVSKEELKQFRTKFIYLDGDNRIMKITDSTH